MTSQPAATLGVLPSGAASTIGPDGLDGTWTIDQTIGSISDFSSNPADPTIRDDMVRLWDEYRSSGSLASTLRFNYADGRPRELAYRLEPDAAMPGRHRLTVQVLPSE